MKTERLFDKDPYKREFTARVIGKRDAGENQEIVLERTLFYPTSGGQPADRGVLGGVPVVDVFEEGERIVHVTNGKVPDGERVEGSIDWDRRFDHMQQHTGQHILSQAFVLSASAKTVGFHLGSEASSIDLDVADLSAERIAQTESIANGVVFENRDVVLHEVPFEKIASIPLRKPTQRESTVRVVEVSGFDWSGCCGTHVKRTGDVGLIKVVRWERYKGGTRVTFLCGWRALRDYQGKLETVKEVCRVMTSGESEVLETLVRWQQEKKATTKKLRFLTDALLENEAKNLMENAEHRDSYTLVSTVFQDREAEEIQGLLKKLIRFENVVALIGLKKERGYLFFGRSQSLSLDMKRLVDRAGEVMGAVGGGSEVIAQASSEEVSQVEVALEKARHLLTAKMV